MCIICTTRTNEALMVRVGAVTCSKCGTLFPNSNGSYEVYKYSGGGNMKNLLILTQIELTCPVCFEIINSFFMPCLDTFEVIPTYSELLYWLRDTYSKKIMDKLGNIIPICLMDYSRTEKDVVEELYDRNMVAKLLTKKDGFMLLYDFLDELVGVVSCEKNYAYYSKKHLLAFLERTRAT